MNNNYEAMGIPELEKVLADLLDQLEDAEDLRESTLGQNGHHFVSAARHKPRLPLAIFLLTAFGDGGSCATSSLRFSKRTDRIRRCRQRSK